MNLHFAGSDGNEKYNAIITECNGLNRLESFYSLKTKAPSMQYNLLLDSGGFVARTKGTVISVAAFADYLNKFNVQLAFNLDTNDVEETLKNQAYLVEKTKTTILPVYHYSDFANPKYREILHDFIRDFDYISIGGLVGTHLPDKVKHEFVDYVFWHTQDKKKVHGLGITELPMLKRYPFYSVDSTSWLSAARFGNCTSIRDKNWQTFIARKRHYLESTLRECEYWMYIQQYTTELWQSRGVNWN